MTAITPLTLKKEAGMTAITPLTTGFHEKTPLTTKSDEYYKL